MLGPEPLHSKDEAISLPLLGLRSWKLCSSMFFLLTDFLGNDLYPHPGSSGIASSPNPTAAKGSDGQPMMVTVPGGLSPGMSFEAGQGRAQSFCWSFSKHLRALWHFGM